MTRLLGIVLICVLMFFAWIAAGLFLLLAPVRAGNLIHDSFGLFPEVRGSAPGKKLVLRVFGLALLGFAAHFAIRIASLISQKQL